MSLDPEPARCPVTSCRYGKDLSATAASGNGGTSFHTLLFCLGFAVVPSSSGDHQGDRSNKTFLSTSPLRLNVGRKNRTEGRTWKGLEKEQGYIGKFQIHMVSKQRENYLTHIRNWGSLQSGAEGA